MITIKVWFSVQNISKHSDTWLRWSRSSRASSWISYQGKVAIKILRDEKSNYSVDQLQSKSKADLPHIHILEIAASTTF